MTPPLDSFSSPPTSGMGSSDSGRSNSSSESHLYEDLDVQPPPKLAPVSGVFGSKGKAVIRPIAFRPVPTSKVVPHRYTTPTSGSSRRSGEPSPYSSESELKSGRHSGLPYLGDDAYSVDSCLKLSDTSASYGSPLAEFPGTPSPSDSGVAELEAMLREKDSEICHLRETLEQNEQVIFKVYEEKEEGWQRELRRLRGHSELQLRACRQQLARVEHHLAVQAYEVQEDRRRLQEELRAARREKEAVEQQLGEVRAQLEETQWELSRKTSDPWQRDGQAQEEQDGLREEVTRLRDQLLRNQEELRATQDAVQKERVQWMEEKDKVIRYQKQLQLNYVQMYRRNRALEAEVQQLALELEGRLGESTC